MGCPVLIRKFSWVCPSQYHNPSRCLCQLCLVTGWWSSWSSSFPDKGGWHRFSDTRYAVPPELRSAPVLAPVSIIRSFHYERHPISPHDRWRLRVTVAQERGVPWPGFNKCLATATHQLTPLTSSSTFPYHVNPMAKGPEMWHESQREMIISHRLALHGMGQATGRKDVIHHLNSVRVEGKSK
jgi:hypothetical protein